MRTAARRALRPGPAWSIGSAITLALVAAVAALTWASVALAHVGRHSLPGATALAAAAVGAWGWHLARELRRGRRGATGAPRTDAGVPSAGDARDPSAGSELPPAAGLVAAPARDWGGRVAELGTLVAIAGFAAWMFFPGFPWAVADRDPGVYLAHAAHIARTGDFALVDAVADPAFGLAWTDGWGWRDGRAGRFPGYWIQDAAGWRVVPQFYATYPALLATAIDAAGIDAAVAVNPALATLATMLVYLLLRAAAGGAAGVVGGVLFASQMLQVWQAKYPTAEILAQVLVLGAALALAGALERRSAALAGLAGALATLTFVARPDGLVIFAGGVAGWLLWQLGEHATAHRGFLAGLLVPLPHALLQAYHPHLNVDYTRANAVPGVTAFAAGAAAAIVVGVVLRFTARRGQRPLLPTQIPCTAGWVAFAAGSAVLALGYLRGSLFGPHLLAGGQRTYNEQTLWRLTWFFTPPGMIALWLGLAALCLTATRRRAAAWLLVGPALAFLPIYLYDPRIDAGLMWWGRRFVPYVVPGMVALVAIGLAALAAAGLGRDDRSARHRSWRPIPILATAATALYLVLAWLRMSLPLRHHPEMRGALELIDELGTLGNGRMAVVLWHSNRMTHAPGFSFGGPVWSYHDQISALLPVDVTATELTRYAELFHGLPLFLITDDDTPPAALAALPWTRVRRHEVVLPMWEETVERRPYQATSRRFEFTVWRLGGETAPASGAAAAVDQGRESSQGTAGSGASASSPAGASSTS